MSFAGRVFQTSLTEEAAYWFNLDLNNVLEDTGHHGQKYTNLELLPYTVLWRLEMFYHMGLGNAAAAEKIQLFIT
jgi:hypothetical protein